MKRIIILVILVAIAVTCVGVGWATYRAAEPAPSPLSKYVPAGPLLYLEAKDFSKLVGDWSSSPEKERWLQSDNYEVFSRSRLFLRLKGAGDQFAAAAGLPPDMNLLPQVAGERSALALYDIGNLQFLYITYLPSAKSMQTTLWQMRAKFEPRNAGGVDFYVRRDPESQREVAFAVAGDYLLLATREDLMAGVLQLMAGGRDRTIENEQWWTQSTSAAGAAGDLRMVLDLEHLVPNGYFRTYWVQQNITNLKQYSAALSDLFRSRGEYREERVLIRRTEPKQALSSEGAVAAADLARLVPSSAGLYVANASPTADTAFSLLETKLLAPHVGPEPPSQIAPSVQLSSGERGSGEQGSGSDLETQLDRAPGERAATSSTSSELKQLLEKTPILASLVVQSSELDKAGVFVKIRSAVVLMADSEWDQASTQTALTHFVRSGLTASQLGVGWQQKSSYEELNGLLLLFVSVKGKYLLVSDDAVLTESILSNFSRKSERQPADLLAGFNHQLEGGNFTRFSKLVDRPREVGANGQNRSGEPQFFSGNVASLGASLSDIFSENIEVRADAEKVRQTVTYEWAK
ncbi:MAG: hypothetical protein WBV36_20725 [Terriglobales bacterium]